MKIPFLKRKKKGEPAKKIKIDTPDQRRILRQDEYRKRLENQQERRSYGSK